jgi:hypothetical protein
MLWIANPVYVGASPITHSSIKNSMEKNMKQFDKNKGVAKSMVLKPLYKMRVCKNKTKFCRKAKHHKNSND